MQVFASYLARQLKSKREFFKGIQFYSIKIHLPKFKLKKFEHPMFFTTLSDDTVTSPIEKLEKAITEAHHYWSSTAKVLNLKMIQSLKNPLRISWKTRHISELIAF